MDNKDVINFSKFFEEELTSRLSNLDNDLFLSEEIVTKKPIAKKSKPQVDDAFDPPVDIEDFVPEDEDPEELDFEDSLGSYENEKNFTKVKEDVSNYYSVYKDKVENFSCDVMVEGAKLNETQARLILESDEWTLMFEGEIDRNGRCTIPVKKLNILEEGMTGKIRLEVIAENTVFTPWQDEFKVKMSKKVTVQFNETKYNRGKNLLTESQVKVKVRK